MKNHKLLRAVLWAIAFFGAGNTQAVEIRGTISSTLTITEDSWLTGDVTCKVDGGPCIRVGASNITLWLLGFTMTGQGDPPSGCFAGGPGANPESGINITGQRRVEVFGPGLVQRFRGFGIILGAGTTRATLKDLTISSNCNTGIQLAGASDNDIEANVSVRNGNREGTCGGICIAGSDYNRVRRNVTSGNGYAVTDNTNFGIALLGTSRGNAIEGNSAVGNVNGIFLQAGAFENSVHGNVLSGNPPIQISLSVEGFPGFDIRNLAPAGANTIYDNLCTTYSGAGPAPCPNIIALSGR
jgi:parallel beta-helix repeat protein